MERVIPAAGDLCFGFRANAAGPAIIGATGAAYFMRSIAHSRQFLLDVERSILSSGLHTEDVRNQIFILQFSILIFSVRRRLCRPVLAYLSRAAAFSLALHP